MATKINKAVKISQKHLLGIQDLSINDVNLILEEAKSFIKLNQSKNKRLNVLSGKTQINLFFEPSTRTQSSFELAGDLNSIFDFIEKLNELNTDNVEPLTSVAETTLKLRADEVKSKNIRDQILKNSPEENEDFFVVPRVVE